MTPPIETIELPDYPEFSGKAGMPLSSEISERPTDQDFINALKTVEDPDLGIDVYNLGLIYNITPKENGDVYVDMTLTSPTCPYAEQLLQASADAVADLKGVGEVFVKAVWEPAWTLERLSEEARYDLDLL